jgi:uncharacterized protein YdeI (YjbR/CyaY-like superfamily)
MAIADPRVDAYLAAAAEFARPVLTELRKRVHAACPDVVETIKWRHPSFTCEQGLIGGMAAFKQHCVFGFWRHDVLVQQHPEWRAALDACGRLVTVRDLPPTAWFKTAMRAAIALAGSDVKAKKAPKRARAEVAVHPDFAKALAASKQAKRHFDAFAPSHRREYLEWIADAKRDETRARRIEQAIEWLSTGKHRNWKYENC